MLRRNLVKVFTVTGFFGGEIYMLFTVLPTPGAAFHFPTSTIFWRVVTSALFFGPFGAAVGLGIGLLVSGLLQRRPK